LMQPVQQIKKLGISAEADGFIRILPNRYPTDGFFVAVMERI